MSMFLSIINDNFGRVRENVNQKDDQEIYSFMLDRFLRWTSKIKLHLMMIFEYGICTLKTTK